MPHGFQSISDSGQIQIDPEFRNLALIQQGTTPAVGAFGVGFVSFPTQTTCPPAIFGRPVSAGGEMFFIGAVHSHDSGTIYNGQSYSEFAVGGNADGMAGFEYVVFGFESVPAVTDTHGLQVFNTAAQLVYDSRKKYMAINSLNQITSGTPGTRTITVPDSGELPWVLLNNIPSNPGFGGDDQYLLPIGIKVNSNTQIVLTYYQSSDGAPGSTFAVYGSPFVMTGVLK